ncbi:JAB domain-containing protein [Opitutus sp. ER46]|uniref:JAB domain-containing protein n=1 Tax=Opitutus sp. ER46 TaxID=2161864 RepID=UPI000D30ED32|nr:JAB domain-containing protein [Opitutus sp. ER46]PTX92321.1 DNA repair protein RadC [Opitutus sp. ER46]
MRVFEASISYRLVQDGETVSINSSQRASEYLKSAFDETPTQEAFWVILLDRKNRPLGRTRISLGTLTCALAAPREVFRAAILASAAAIIAAHNHPSGDPAPSSADVHLTRQLREAARIMDIELVDHVIVGDPVSDPTGRGIYSFREAGLI